MKCFPLVIMLSKAEPTGYGGGLMIVKSCLAFLLGMIAFNPVDLASAQNANDAPKAQNSKSHVVAAGDAMRMSGQLLVKYKTHATATDIESLNSSLGVRVLKTHQRSRIQRVEIAEGTALAQALETFKSSSIVEQAGYNYILEAFAIPNDTEYQPYQWNLHNTAGGIWAEDAWNSSLNKGQGITVAVIDTGVAYEDFAPFVQAPDLNKHFVSPKDFHNNDDHPNDDNGHGTHVTGTIAQDTNNNLATAGIAYQANIMPLKVLDAVSAGFADDLNEALYYAVDNGARVINLSLGFAGTGKPDPSGQVCTQIAGLNAALQYAYDNNVVVVAAAGNDGGNVVNCPAAYPTVIAVGATRFDGQRANYSTGGSALHIVAPGGDLTVDQNGDGAPDGILQVSFCNEPEDMWNSYYNLGINQYDEFCSVARAGTSMATPHVTATVALMLGENPSLTPDLVRNILASTARDYGAVGWDPSYGWGLLHAGAAVLEAMGGIPPPPPSPPVPATATVKGFVTDAADGSPIAGATVLARLKGNKYVVTTLADGSYEISGLPFGEYTITASEPIHHRDHLRGVLCSESSPAALLDFALPKKGKN